MPELQSNPNGGGWRNLYQLHDTQISDVQLDDILKWNGTSWVNTPGFDPSVTLADVSATLTMIPKQPIRYTHHNSIVQNSSGDSLLRLLMVAT